MKIALFISLFVFAGLIPANFICAAEPLDIVISEIAWMGTDTSSADEWIELYNNTTSTIDITGWTLKSGDNSPNIIFETEIGSKTGGGRVSSCFLVSAHGFYLMERTNDDTVSDITADYIYTGALNNEGETLELRDAQGNLIDAVDFADKWLFGNNATKQTMERKNLLLSSDTDNWQTSDESGGTPLAENSFPTEPEQNNGNLSVINDKSSISFPSNIFINEILPSPDGPDAENEWIEIFNQNDFSIDISGWKITDIEGSAKSYSFPQNTIIKAKSFLLLPRPQTKITLNNDGDGLNLIHSDGTIIDSAVYQKAKLNQSYNRINDVWVWSNTVTPGWKNIVSNPINNTAYDIDDIKENSVSSADENGYINNHNGDKHSNLTADSDSSQTTVAISNKHFTASLLSLFSAFSILALKRSLSKQ